MKLLVRAPNWIGDAVMSIPALTCLNRNNPSAEIWLAGTPWVDDVFRGKEFIRGFLVLSSRTTLASLKKDARMIRNEGFDAGLLLTNSFASALLFAKARIPQRWGYNRDGRALLLTQAVKPPVGEPKLHQVHYYTRLVEQLGECSCSPELSLEPDEDDIQEATKILLSQGINLEAPIVALNPGAYYGTAKRWPAARFVELARKFQGRSGTQIVFFGSSEERSLAEEIGSRLSQPPLVLSGKTTLRQLIALLSLTSLFVTNDSGPMHLANAIKTPVVAIFGPTDFRVTGPFQAPSAIIRKDVSCWPCSYRSCPLDHRCMLEITAEEVFQTCQEFLQ